MTTTEFALCPAGKAPRLIRYLTPDEWPMDRLCVAALKPAENLLIINKEYFDTLTEVTQGAILRTHDIVTYLTPVGTDIIPDIT